MNWTNEQTRIVRQAIYNIVPVHTEKHGLQYRHDEVGEKVKVYTYAVNDENNAIMINGNAYKVEWDSVFTYKIMKTKIKAINGAAGLLRFLMSQYDCMDSVEENIMNITKAI